MQEDAVKVDVAIRAALDKHSLTAGVAKRWRRAEVGGCRFHKKQALSGNWKGGRVV
jgi:hypothetical protein